MQTQTHTTPEQIFPRADRYLLAITLIWGSTFAVTKIVLLDIPPLYLQGVRFGIASLIVGIYARNDIRATTRASLRAGVVLGVLLGSGFALQTIGLVETTASKGGFLTGTLVVFTPMLQMIIERRRPTTANYIGVALVMAGLFILTSPEGGSFTQGDLLILACAIIFAFHIVYLDVFTKAEFRREVVFYQFVVSGIIGFAFDAAVPSAPPRWSAGVIGAILYLSVFATVIALFVQTKFQRETTPTKAAIIYTMEPVIAAAIAYFALDERLNATAGAGAGLMVAGLLVSEILSARKSANSDTTTEHTEDTEDKDGTG